MKSNRFVRQYDWIAGKQVVGPKSSNRFETLGMIAARYLIPLEHGELIVGSVNCFVMLQE